MTTELYDILKETFEAGQKNCGCAHADDSAVIEQLRKDNELLWKRIEHYKDLLKQVRVALIQERVANIYNGVDVAERVDTLIKTMTEKK